MRELRLPGGVHAVVRVRSADTGGAFTVLTDSAPPGWRLPPHSHRDESETIHVTAGHLRMTVAGREHHLDPGETIHVPAGTVHSGGTLGDVPVERLIVFAPGGMDEFFERLAETPPEAAYDLAVAHGWRF